MLSVLSRNRSLFFLNQVDRAIGYLLKERGKKSIQKLADIPATGISELTQQVDLIVLSHRALPGQSGNIYMQMESTERTPLLSDVHEIRMLQDLCLWCVKFLICLVMK